MSKLSFIIAIVSVSASFIIFQNCSGPNAHQNDVQSTNTDDGSANSGNSTGNTNGSNTGGTGGTGNTGGNSGTNPIANLTLMSQIYDISIPGSGVQDLAVFVESVNSDGEIDPALFITSTAAGSQNQTLIPTSTHFEYYVTSPPKVFQLSSASAQRELIFRKDNSKRLVNARYNGSTLLEIGWNILLVNPVTAQDLLTSRVEQTANSYDLIIGNNRIKGIETIEPVVSSLYNCSIDDLLPDNTCPPTVSCPMNTHPENGICVSNNRACVIANGTGTETWDNGMWPGLCEATECKNTNFALRDKNNDGIKDACVRVACSSPNRHFWMGQCHENVIDCSSQIANGSGEKTWKQVDNDYTICKVTICDSGYIKSNNSCIPK